MHPRVAFALVLAAPAPLWAQVPGFEPWLLPAPMAIDTAHPPAATKPVPYRRDALLPHSRIVAYYGNPLSTRMGVLGATPPSVMLPQLDSVAAEWAKVDSTRTVRPALHLIVTVAQPHPGSDGMYRLRHSDSLIARVVRWADERNWLVFLDVQAGRAAMAGEIERLVPWLRRPNVHLALDPEFAMQADAVPGRRIGTIDAAVVNAAIDRLAAIVEAGRLPPKVLVVHRFTERMLTNYQQIRHDPRVQVVIHMDGFGSQGSKRSIYQMLVERQPVQFAGIKLFTKNDKPMFTPSQVVQMLPTPVYVQYQ